jgi:hypothetical protein
MDISNSLGQAAGSIWKELKFRTQAAMLDTASALFTLIFGEIRRSHTVGFGPKEIPPHTTIAVQTQPQVLFRGKKIASTGESKGLYIKGLFVGQRAQLPTFSNPIAMAVFDGDGIADDFPMDLCDPALFITWQIENVTDAPIMWSASIRGEMIHSWRERLAR